MKTAIITGASHGVGKALAYAFADEYDYIALCARNKDGGLNEVVNDINKKKMVAHTFAIDVSNYDEVTQMVSDVISECGHIDLLINNAGISMVGLLMDMSYESWKEINAVNVDSVFNTCRLAVPHMVREQKGKIINVSSVWGNVGASCEVAYSATKGAVNSFSRALAKELAPSNISVNAISLGAIDTRMNSNLDDAEKEQLSDEIPFGRMATPAEAALFIKHISEMPEYFTGEVVKFDGAWI